MESITVTQILAEFGFEVDDKNAKAWGGAVDNLKNKMGDAVQMAAKLAAGIGLIATGFFALTKQSAESADENIKSARRLGMQVEAYQELKFASEQSGLQGEQFNEMLARQNTILGQAAKREAGATEALKALGLTYSELEQLSPDRQFERLADAVTSIENPSKRAAAASRIFGETWSRAASLMESGSEGIQKLREQAQSLGFVVSEEAAKSAEEFNDSIARLQLRIAGLRNRIGFTLMPILQRAIHRFEEWWSANREIIEQRLDVWAEKLGNGLEKVGDFLEKLPAQVEKLGGLEKILSRSAKILAFMAAIKIAIPFINLAMALKPIIIGIKAAGIAGAVAAGKFILLATVAIAKIAAVFLIVEDIFQFIRGNDSVLGRIVKGIQEWWKAAGQAEGAVGSLVRMVQALGRFVVAVVDLIWRKVKPTVDEIKEETTGFFDGVIDALTEFWEQYLSPIVDAIGATIGSMFGGWIDTITGIFDMMTEIFNGATTGVENFDQIVILTLARIQAKIAETIGQFKNLGGALASEIPFIGGLLAPAANAMTQNMAGMAQNALVGPRSSNQSVSVTNQNTFNVNGAGDPITTAAVIDRKQSNRETNTYRQARAAFAGSER